MEMSRTRLLVALCVFFGYPLSVTGYQKHALKTRQVFGVKTYNFHSPLIKPYKTTTDARNKMDCVVECASNTSCMIVDHFNQTCAFYDFPPELADDETSTHSLVIMRGVFVLNVNTLSDVRYQYTFSQAKQACEDRGARLANRTELQALYETGYDLCLCGWIADGQAVFLAHLGRIKCGDIRGVITCGWSTQFNAWCSFV